MSRTDVHAPAWVKERDPAWRRFFLPSHNHLVRKHWDEQSRRWLLRRLAPCDLAEFLAGVRGTRCSMVGIGGRNIHCGCRNCTGQFTRKWARRQERQWGQRICRDLVKALPSDRDCDIPYIRGSAG